MKMNSLLLAMALAVLPMSVQAETLAEGFASPPADARPMVRWWWFGPNVQDDELVREIKAMKAGGFGGFEIQSVYPLTLDGNTSYLSDDFLHSVRLANETGRQAGLRVDVTLGSGWPFGGPHISVEDASSRITLVKLPLPAHASAVDLPPLKAGDHVVAVFAGPDMMSAREVIPADARIELPPADQDRTVFLVLQTPTGQQVKRPAIGAEGNVLDHMSAQAVQTHLAAVGDKLISAFGDHPPYAVFSDSLEVYGADWTDDVLSEFQRRRGYDLKPHLLELFSETPTSGAVRHDWGLTLSELTEERYLTPIDDWATRHNTRFRSQTYGFPPVTLSSSRLVRLPEGEGAQWRKFSTTRWASSANHIYGNTVTSAESWTWLHQGAFQATPIDIKAEADLLMLEGVNQFIAHGWPYSPPEAGEPGWAFYAAAVFNDHNPWWGVMPDVNAYLQRMSFLMRQGVPVTDVAILLPEDDALAGIKPGAATVNGQMDKYVTEALTTQILDTGFAFDYTDAQAVMTHGITASILILPATHRIAPELYKKIEAYAKAGGQVVAVDTLPDTGTGLINADTNAVAVRAISNALFAGTGSGHFVPVGDLGQMLKTLVPPDLTGAPPQIGFVHRRLEGGDIYFVVNTGNTPVTAPIGFRAKSDVIQWWDPRLGQVHDWKAGPTTLAPYESRVFVFGKSLAAKTHLDKAILRSSRELAGGWSIAFANQPAKPLENFTSWPDPHYSGVATYSYTLRLSKADITAGLTTLDFGAGTPITPTTGRQNGTRALLTPPLRETAEVFVNGKRAGSVWTAPFTLSLAGFVHAGDNRLEIRVANTAVNTLAGRPKTDYSALDAKYGERFQAQNMDSLKPLPSGLLQAPVLVSQ